jgi:formylglycine-generating enzyme
MTRYYLTVLLLFTVVFTIEAQHALRSGKDYAVLFYVAHYESGWADLPETKTETAEIAAELRDNFGFEVEMVDNPTKQDIEDKILEINRREYGPDDQVLLFFSMHGFIRTRGYLVPADGQLSQADILGKSWLSYDDLGEYLTLNSSKHLLLLLDACYSGSFGSRTKGEPEGNAWDEKPDCRDLIKNALTYHSRLYFTSGSSKERTPSSSQFARCLLRVLRSGIEKGVLRTRDLHSGLLMLDNPKPEAGSFSVKHQEYGDFVFVHKNACGISKDLIDKTLSDSEAWALARQENTIISYQHYLYQYPKGAFIKNARAEIRKQETAIAWSRASESRSVKALKSFIDNYPESNFVEVARTLIAELELEQNKEAGEGSAAFGNLKYIEGKFFKAGHKAFRISDFYMSPYEVTFDEYDEFCEETGRIKPSDNNWGRGKLPVTNVSWYDAVAYCNWRSKKEKLDTCYEIGTSYIKTLFDKNGYRLPTEEEWEHAASMAEIPAAQFGNFAWYANNSDRKSHPVGDKTADHVGTYDLLGNVAEWTNDWFSQNYRYELDDEDRDRSKVKVVRGGSWKDMSRFCTPENRAVLAPDMFNNSTGFRLVRSKID